MRIRDDGAEKGSIPACAGEPNRSVRALDRTMVYPRVCGGTLHARVFGEDVVGLSPRVRGNRLLPCPRPHNLRSIPACAGEPRYVGSPSGVIDGLSPRVRGNLEDVSYLAMAGRSIPACAGEPRTVG